jgi:hypothetical protein
MNMVYRYLEGVVEPCCRILHPQPMMTPTGLKATTLLYRFWMRTVLLGVMMVGTHILTQICSPLVMPNAVIAEIDRSAMIASQTSLKTFPGVPVHCSDHLS